MVPTFLSTSRQYLVQAGCVNEAAVQMASLVNDDHFVSLENKSKHELWADLCSLISKHPEKMSTLNVEAIIRGGTNNNSTYAFPW